MKVQTPQILPGAEPFYMPGGKTGVLILHGIAASPHEVHWLGEYLNQHRLTVYGPRIVGHGADYRDLTRMQWQDWYLSALDGYHLLQSTCDRVFLCGMSMGGLLATLLGVNHPAAGVVLLATPFQLDNERTLRMARYIRYVRRYLNMTDESDFPDRLREAQKARGLPAMGRVRYDIWATQAVAELYRLMVAARDQLPQLSIPTLLIYSEHDPTVPLMNLDYARRMLDGTPLETFVVSEGGHILTQDHAREKVFERVRRFIMDGDDAN